MDFNDQVMKWEKPGTGHYLQIMFSYLDGRFEGKVQGRLSCFS